MKLIRPVHLLLWLISLCLMATGSGIRAAVAAPDTELTDLDRQIPFALAVRGGVSLGAYESGFNWACLSAHIERTYLALGIQDSPPANTVFQYLLRREFAEESTWEDEFAWANTDTEPALDRNMLAIANSLFVDPVETGATAYIAPSMTAFISGLIDEQYDAGNSSAFLQK